MNTRAGRGDYLFIELHSASGQPLIFAVDTGSYLTIIDQSLESTLGTPIGKEELRFGWAKHVNANQYQPPKLFLSATELQLGHYVVADDVRAKLSRRVAGILGTDCLSHYCLQFDFAARTIHFLDPEHLPTADLGEAFSLTNQLSELTTRADALGFHDVRFYIDTGDFGDGVIVPNLWKKPLPGQLAAIPGEIKTINGQVSRNILLPEMELGHATYTNVVMKDASVGNTPHVNVLGLKLLARNLVTLDFQKQRMYLKPLSLGPLKDDGRGTNTLTYSATRFLIHLKRQNQLPGWKENERGGIQEDSASAITFGPPLKDDADFHNFRLTLLSKKSDETSLYHFTVFRASPTSDWKLEKAWLTDPTDKLIQEFPVK